MSDNTIRTKMDERCKMVLAMEYIARQINNEEIMLDLWLSNGVADGDIEYGCIDTTKVDEYYTEDENFKKLMTTFLLCMKDAWKDGGLYCGGIVSKDKSDYE